MSEIGREGEAGLHRSLSHGQLSMIAIGGAIGTGLFLGSGFAISTAGPAVLVSYLVGGVISLLLMGALAEMTVAQPSAGSFGTFADRYLGDFAGFLVRYAYLSCIILAVGTEVTAVAVYMRYWFPATPGLYWIGAFGAALALVNGANVRAFGAVEYVLSLTKIVAILLFIALGAWWLFGPASPAGAGFANYVRYGGFFPHGLWGAWVAVIIAIFSYFSIEMIAVAAAEAAEPARAVVKAFKATIARLVVFYLATIALMLAIIPWPQAGAGGSPFVIVMEGSGIDHAGHVVNAVILIAALSAMNSQIYVASRMLFALARAGHAPALFGRLTRAGVPRAALAFALAGIAVAGAAYAWRPDEAFPLMISVSVCGAMLTWTMIFLMHIAFRQRHGRPPTGFRMWGAPWTSWLGAALMIAILLTTPFTEAFRMTLPFGVPFYAIIALAYRRRARAVAA